MIWVLLIENRFVQWRHSEQRIFYIYIFLNLRINKRFVPQVEFIYIYIHLVFIRMPGESYRRRLRSLLMCLCDVFPALINSLVCWL